MEDIVKQALVKWPNVPHCYGWLGLDARGQWYMRDDRVQALGAFASGVAQAKGSLLKHDKLIAFIHRNYEADAQGQWFFQNGPQRVYVELQATPLIFRVNGQGEVTDHTGKSAKVELALTDEHGHLYLQADTGVGLVHSMDMLEATNLLDVLRLPLAHVLQAALPERFGYVPSPQTRQPLPKISK